MGCLRLEAAALAAVLMLLLTAVHAVAISISVGLGQYIKAEEAEAREQLTCLLRLDEIASLHKAFPGRGYYLWIKNVHNEGEEWGEPSDTWCRLFYYDIVLKGGRFAGVRIVPVVMIREDGQMVWSSRGSVGGAPYAQMIASPEKVGALKKDLGDMAIALFNRLPVREEHGKGNSVGYSSSQLVDYGTSYYDHPLGLNFEHREWEFAIGTGVGRGRSLDELMNVSQEELGIMPELLAEHRDFRRTAIGLVLTLMKAVPLEEVDQELAPWAPDRKSRILHRLRMLRAHCSCPRRTAK